MLVRRALLAVVTLQIQVFATDEAVCDKAGKQALEYHDEPSNETLHGLVEAFAYPDCPYTDEVMDVLTWKCKKPSEWCALLEDMIMSKCGNYINGDEPQFLRSSIEIIGLLVGVKVESGLRKEDKFPFIFEKTVEQIAVGPDDKILQTLSTACNKKETLEANKKVIRDTCSSLGGWIDALNETALAMEMPETLREHINSLTGKYAKSAIRHFKRSWNPSDTPTLYDEQCSSAAIPTTGSDTPDIYCEVLKQRLEAYKEECARDPTKCIEKPEEKSGVRNLEKLTFCSVLFCILLSAK